MKQVGNGTMLINKKTTIKGVGNGAIRKFLIKHRTTILIVTNKKLKTLFLFMLIYTTPTK
jgi:hypothetical protein